jgi:DNA-binding NtrC family response regulator
MGQLRILIVLPHPRHADPTGSSLAGELRTILQRSHAYHVELRDGPLPAAPASLEPAADLIIPILTGSKQPSRALLATLRAMDPGAPLLPVLRAADLEERWTVLSSSITDFLVAPLRAIEVHAHVSRLASRTRTPERGADTEGLEQLVGEDPVFVAVKRKLPLMARSDAPVLITGETGTGKELCARALHYLSRRAGKPFLPVNCGAIPVELFESELFGHTRGAFTGAWAAQRGFIEEAEGGTLFLDEVEALTLRCQVKLLRFLEDHTYHTLGSPRARRADVWIVAATNISLAQMVREGTFRADLFYRLAVLNVDLPPLRERRQDIPRLVAHLWSRHAGGESRRFSARALEALCGYDWPGNIRELENVIRQLAVLTGGRTIEPSDLSIRPPSPPPEARGASLKQAKALAIERFERAYLSELMEAHHGNITRAARAAQKERRAFGRLIKKYQLAAR